MYKLNKSVVPQRQQDGLLSHILLQQGDVPNTQLSVTWVEVEPGASQKPHKHSPEQCYIIIQGHGKMNVGEESCIVEKGDIIHIPSNYEPLYDEGDLKK
jgi:quercetin dioxygenase-like cupin family protein